MVQKTVTMDVCDDLKPKLPAGDDLTAASAVLNEVVAATLVLHEALRGIANHHDDAAPASSGHVADLMNLVASEVTDWIRRWPA